LKIANEDLELRTKQANQIADQAREVMYIVKYLVVYIAKSLHFRLCDPKYTEFEYLQGEKKTRCQMEEKVVEELRLKREIDQMRKEIEQLQATIAFNNA
jgi:hypothetical protein